MDKLKFNEEKHTYELNGELYPSVTTVLNVINKPALIPWAVKLCAETAKARIEKITDGTNDSVLITDTVLDIIDEAKKAWREKRDSAGDIGKEFHKLVEMGIKDCMENNNGYDPYYEFPENTKDYTQLDKMFVAFLKWCNSDDVKFLQTETKLYSPRHKYAGTMDILCEIGGLKYVADIKTSSGIYPTMFYQTAAYQYAFTEHNPDVVISGNMIINVTKEAKLRVEENYNYADNLSAFLSALNLYLVAQK